MTLRTFNISNIGTVINKTPEIIVRHKNSTITSLANTVNETLIISPVAIIRHQIQTVKSLLSVPLLFSGNQSQSQQTKQPMFWS